MPVVSVLSFSPMNKAILLKSLRINKFNHYVFIDEKDSLNQLNAFPANEAFHTLLLDKNNKVLAMGNPIHNPNQVDAGVLQCAGGAAAAEGHGDGGVSVG